MTHCTFHPLNTATHSCTRCVKNFCLSCSNEQDYDRRRDSTDSYSCFICDLELEAINAGATVRPFWRRLDQVYRYPSSLAAIVVIVLASALSALFSLSLLAIIPTIIMMLYCFACLRTTAKGDMLAPTFENCFDGSVAPFFKLIGIFLIGFLFIGILSALGTGFGILAGLFCLLALPASIITLAIEESFLAALNPSKMVSIISRTGASYFVAFLFIFIMFSSLGALTYMVGEANSFFNLFLFSAISNYYNVVIFHILGYLVFQNADALGFAVQRDSNKKIRSDEQRLEAKIEVLIKAGDYAKAIELTAQQVKSNTASLSQWRRCMKLLLAGGSDTNIKNFSERYLAKLEKDGQAETMADDYVSIKRRIKDFEPKDFEQKLRIARSLMEIGKYKRVIQLMRNFTQTTKDKQQIGQSMKLLSQAYEKVPGFEKNARFYQQQYKMLNSRS